MPTDVQSLLRLEVPLLVLVGERTMSLRDVTQLAPGAIIELPKSPDEQLDVLVNDKVIGRGRAVKVGENFGVRLGEMNDPSQRVRALGEESKESTPSDVAEQVVENAANESTTDPTEQSVEEEVVEQA